MAFQIAIQLKKALDWLKANQVAFEFHDFKKLGVTAQKLDEWAAKAGFEKLVNRQGLTYKQLSAEEKAETVLQAGALKLLQQKTSMIKRPVIEDEDFLFFGFDEDAYKQHFILKR